jgi:UDP-N-acetylglucosamine 2-epimerase
MHPRTTKKLEEFGISLAPNIVQLAPVGYAEMLTLLRDAFCVITDSGGLQKEAYFVGTPCITCRTETEWTETVESGWNLLCDPDSGVMKEFVERVPTIRPLPRPMVYGDGSASEKIASILLSQ